MVADTPDCSRCDQPRTEHTPNRALLVSNIVTAHSSGTGRLLLLAAAKLPRPLIRGASVTQVCLGEHGLEPLPGGGGLVMGRIVG